MIDDAETQYFGSIMDGLSRGSVGSGGSVWSIRVKRGLNIEVDAGRIGDSFSGLPIQAGEGTLTQVYD